MVCGSYGMACRCEVTRHQKHARRDAPKHTVALGHALEPSLLRPCFEAFHTTPPSMQRDTKLARPFRPGFHTNSVAEPPLPAMPHTCNRLSTRPMPALAPPRPSPAQAPPASRYFERAQPSPPTAAG
eukprot:206628-Chlamydomonas_euryale.AAC.3